MIGHLFRAVGQLSDTEVSGVIGRSILGTLALFLSLLGAIAWALTHTALFEIGWLEGLADVATGLMAILIAWLMFPAVMVAVSSLMLERVVHAVERRWYPGLPPAREQSFSEGLVNSLKFLGVVVGMNLLALPLYFIPVVGQIVYYSLNGYLVGREYFELVALRRLDPGRMRYLRSEGSLGLFLAGVIIAFISVLPIVNLLVPVVAAAFMVHVFEDMRRGLPPPGVA